MLNHACEMLRGVPTQKEVSIQSCDTFSRLHQMGFVQTSSYTVIIFNLIQFNSDFGLPAGI